MIRNLVKSKPRSPGAAVLLAALFAASCETTFPEKSGQMPNENTSRQVEGYQMGNSEAIQPVMPLAISR